MKEKRYRLRLTSRVETQFHWLDILSYNDSS